MSSPDNLDEAFQLLHRDPAGAERACRAALKRMNNPTAELMLAAALRLQNRPRDAFDLTRALALAYPDWPGAQFEHAMALGSMGQPRDALALLNKLAGVTQLPGLWREIGDRYWDLGDRTSAAQAYLRHLSAQPFEPLVHEALVALHAKDSDTAEAALRLQIERYPSDVLALRHLAEILSASDRYQEAESLLRSLLDRAPSFALARYGLASVLLHDHRLPPAFEQVDKLLAAEPNRTEYLNLKAEIEARSGDFEGARASLKTLTEIDPRDGGAWAAYGNILRTLGDREGCEAAYRRAIATGVRVGEAYWGLANLKTFSFDVADISRMRARLLQLAAGDDRTALLFALGKALEDQGDYERAFAAYEEANAERRAQRPHDREEKAKEIDRAKNVFTREFFAAREDAGCKANDPIFIVGMPRSGSTLVEQILASHSRVEGTMELIELLAMAKRLGRDGRFPEKLRHAAPEELVRLGQEYLERASVFRGATRPFFIDKMPNNFLQTGFIHLILPNAKIIDVRRHPLACGLSNFKQHWASGQTFAYDLVDIGVFYRGYVELMAHFDDVLPGRVHRVIYEELVAHPESEVRKLLQACNLTFEESCLRFYENKRAVRTPSSEQVRQPINAAGLESWRRFEPWLGPLKRALGPVLDAYPAVPSLPQR